MTDRPSDAGKGKKDDALKDIDIKADTFSKLTDSELNDVSGGMLPRGGGGKLSGTPTLNPTGSDGCCGANAF